MKIKDIITESIQLQEFVSVRDLEQIEQRINDVWDDDNVEINLHRRGKERDGESHFLHRVNDPRNKPPIEPEEIEDVFLAAHDFRTPRNKLKHMSPGKEAVLVDPSTKVNIPVVASTTKNRETKIIPKTVMRKKNFLTSPSSEKINLPTDQKKPEHQKFKGSSFDSFDDNKDSNYNKSVVDKNKQKDDQPKDKYNNDPKNLEIKPKLKIDSSRIGKF